jgi:hypothetical protein
MNSEFKLLLECTRWTLGGKTTEVVRKAATAQPDWPVFLHMAGVHGVLPLVYDCLSHTCADLVPADLLAAMGDGFRSNQGSNLFVAGELLRILDLLEARGIQAVPLKGPVLSYLIYGNLSHRVFSDIDLLVHRQEISVAKQTLLGDGYRLNSHIDWEENAHFHSNCQTILVGNGGNTTVELHWELTPLYYPFVLRPDSLWARLKSIHFLGRSVLVLPKEELLVFLCGHGAKHMWAELRWLVDLAKLLGSGPECDWKLVLELAGSTGGRRMLFLGLLLTNDLLGVAPPPEILAMAEADEVAGQLAAQVKNRLPEYEGDSLLSRELLPFTLKLAAGPWRKIRFCLGSLLIPTLADWETIRLSRRLSFLYYPLRWARLAYKYAGFPHFRSSGPSGGG